MKRHILDGPEKTTIVVLGQARVFDNGTGFDFCYVVRYSEILQRCFDRSGECTNEFRLGSQRTYDGEVRGLFQANHEMTCPSWKV